MKCEICGKEGAKTYSVDNPVTWTKRGITVCPECFGKNVVTSGDAREQLKGWEVSDGRD